jgi:hypothetical protein
MIGVQSLRLDVIKGLFVNVVAGLNHCILQSHLLLRLKGMLKFLFVLLSDRLRPVVSRRSFDLVADDVTSKRFHNCLLLLFLDDLLVDISFQFLLLNVILLSNSEEWVLFVGLVSTDTVVGASLIVLRISLRHNPTAEFGGEG